MREMVSKKTRRQKTWYTRKFVSRLPESNRWPTPYKGVALTSWAKAAGSKLRIIVSLNSILTFQDNQQLAVMLSQVSSAEI